MTITARQREALAAIDRLGTKPPPSLRELGAELLVSHEAARLLVAALERHDPPAVTVAKGQHRAIRITAFGREHLEQASTTAAQQQPDDRAWRNRYLFGHARDAIRVWAANRDGIRVDRSRIGARGGRTPSIEDIARVGRVLASYSGLQIGTLVEWARAGTFGGDQRTKYLIELVTARLLQLRIVGRAGPVQGSPHRSTWTDDEGQEHATTAFLPGPDDFSCNLAEDSAH